MRFSNKWNGLFCFLERKKHISLQKVKGTVLGNNGAKEDTRNANHQWPRFKLFSSSMSRTFSSWLMFVWPFYNCQDSLRLTRSLRSCGSKGSWTRRRVLFVFCAEHLLWYLWSFLSQRQAECLLSYVTSRRRALGFTSRARPFLQDAPYLENDVLGIPERNLPFPGSGEAHWR